MKGKTDTGIEIIVTPNKKDRTYIIERQGTRYKTLPMSKEEFEENESNTPNDWNNYFKIEELSIIR